MLKTAATSGFSIDWAAFGLVIVASLAAAIVIVTLYSIALRLLASGAPSRTGTTSDAAQHTTSRNPLALIGAVVCIAICVMVVLYGLYLVIPLFHGK